MPQPSPYLCDETRFEKGLVHQSHGVLEVGRSGETNIRLVEFTAHKGGARPEGRFSILDDDALLFRILRRHLFDVNLDLISGAIDRCRESHYVLLFQ